MKQIAWGLIGAAVAAWLALFMISSAQASIACSNYLPYMAVIIICALATTQAVQSLYRGEFGSRPFQRERRSRFAATPR